MFSGLRSDSVALSHVRLGLPGGRFQSDGGFRIAATTVRWWSSSGALRVMWTKISSVVPLPRSQISPVLQHHNVTPSSHSIALLSAHGTEPKPSSYAIASATTRNTRRKSSSAQSKQTARRVIRPSSSQQHGAVDPGILACQPYISPSQEPPQSSPAAGQRSIAATSSLHLQFRHWHADLLAALQTFITGPHLYRPSLFHSRHNTFVFCKSVPTCSRVVHGSILFDPTQPNPTHGQLWPVPTGIFFWQMDTQTSHRHHDTSHRLAWAN